MISKSLIVGMGLTGVGLGLAGTFMPAPAEASLLSCSASTLVGTCSNSFSIPTTQTDWTSVALPVLLFNSTKYGPMTGLSLVLSGAINFGANSTLSNTTTSVESYTFVETSSFSFSNAIPALQAAIAALSPTPIASDGQTLNNVAGHATITLTTSPGVTFSSSLTSAIYETAFEGNGGTSNNAGTTTFFANTLTSQTFTGGGGNQDNSITTFATLTLAYVYSYGVTTPEPLSAAVLGSGLLGLGMLRRRRNKRV